MLFKIKRTFRSGLKNFRRNGMLSVATISVIIITLFLINLQLANIIAKQFQLESIKQQVGIAVYFNPEVSESEVLSIKDEVARSAEVKSVEYISKEKAFEDFKQKNIDNETIQRSINELSENPLGATLNIKAKDPSQYEQLAKMIEASAFREPLVDKVSYKKYKTVIDSLAKNIEFENKIALATGLVLCVVAILVTFISIKITMYSHREEIEVMRLVGASNNYIRLPFVWEGIMYGTIAAVFSLIFFFLYIYFSSKNVNSGSLLSFSNGVYMKQFFSQYFLKNLPVIVLINLAIGILLGIFSSLIAIRKYLKT